MKKYQIFLFLIIISGVLLIFQKPIRISYHRYMKDYCERKARSFPPLDDNKTAYFLKSDLHLRSLVRIGYYERKAFILEHIKVSTPASRELWHSLINSDICEDHIIESNDVEGDGPLKITIYAPPKYIPEYEGIIQSFDAADAQGDM